MDNVQDDVDLVGSIGAIPSILDVICRTTGMGFAAVARVTEQRWIACSVLDHVAFGLKPGGELKVESTICHEIRQHRKAVIIDHVAEDVTYAHHHTPATYGLQSYISMPILLADGTFFGTLCAIDPKPHQLSKPEVVSMFTLFAELIAFHLNALKKIGHATAQLAEERQLSQLREQFVAVLSHDLRNPLGAISNGALLLQRVPLDERGKSIAVMMHECAHRMTELIENVLDFARGRMGGGVSLLRDANAPLEKTFAHIVAEMRSLWPKRTIETQYRLTKPVNADARRIAQLLSNLLTNALKYGAPDMPVRISALTSDTHFEMYVANGGEPIPERTMQMLFKPYERGQSPTDSEGLGLGLYIATEIARAHNGTLSVSSIPEETRFTFSMPLAS